MQAETLHCPSCGAAAHSAEAAQCLYCGSRLATVSCPQCFSLMDRGSRHCPRCGAGAARSAAGEETERFCPHCRVPLEKIVLGKMPLLECARCDGLWVDVASFERICADREGQSAVLGAAHLAPARKGMSGIGAAGVRYVPCPECGQLMNRMNFARCSGVVVDICKGHGTWFEKDELRSIVEFIRAGGLDEARARDKAQLEETRRRLQAEQLAAARARGGPLTYTDDERGSGILEAAGELLKFLKSE